MGRGGKKGAADVQQKKTSQQTTKGLLNARGLEEERWPTVSVKASVFRPFLFRKMIDRADANAQAGDLVAVLDRDGKLAGYGLYNPRSEIVLRMLCFGKQPPQEAFWKQRLEQAVQLRHTLLNLPLTTNAYRVIHAEGDWLPGLVVDRLGDVLSAEVFSLGVYQRVQALLGLLAPLVGTSHWLVRVDQQIHGQEGFLAEPQTSEGCPSHTIIEENGLRFQVDLAGGHKTGFFCDQRDNRRRLAEFCPGRTVLDLCSYTGGFAVAAKKLGQAEEVTAVDLDEEAVAVARQNGKLNDAAVRWVHADAFAYMRDMQRAGKQFDVVVLDPPKLIRNRYEMDIGRRKYHDFNRLALSLVRSGGILLTCSCSGLLSAAEFQEMIQASARHCQPEGSPRPSRNVQMLAMTGAGGDHPVATDCPETSYLKAAWLRVGD